MSYAPHSWLFPVLGDRGAPCHYEVLHLVDGLGWVVTTVMANNFAHATVIAHQAGCLIGEVNKIT